MISRSRVAVVTGASSGVGRAIAVGLAGEGFDTCLVGRDAGRLAETAAAARLYRTTTRTYQADLTHESAIRRIQRSVLRDFEAIDVLVHAAGVISFGDVEGAPIAELDRQYQVNLRAPYLLTQALLPALKRRGGQVVFINSTAGLAGSRGSGAYAATKAGLRGFADSLRAEVNGHGVRVLSLFLGRTATPMQETVHAHEGRYYDSRRLIQPADVSRLLIALLAVPETAEITEVRVRPARAPLPVASEISAEKNAERQPVRA